MNAWIRLNKENVVQTFDMYQFHSKLEFLVRQVARSLNLFVDMYCTYMYLRYGYTLTNTVDFAYSGHLGTGYK